LLQIQILHEKQRNQDILHSRIPQAVSSKITLRNVTQHPQSIYIVSKKYEDYEEKTNELLKNLEG
jgi:hypothetical protein